MTVSIYNDVVSQMPELTNEEVDLKLEQAVIQSEKAEMLVCCYLAEVRERRLFEHFGYANISDYAFARFGFKERKTHYLVRLGKKNQASSEAPRSDGKREDWLVQGESTR